MGPGSYGAIWVQGHMGPGPYGAGAIRDSGPGQGRGDGPWQGPSGPGASPGPHIYDVLAPQ